MKYVTPTNIIFAVWGIALMCISELYYEYVRYYLYLSIAIIYPVMVWNLLKQKKNDKIYGTEKLKHSINRMMFLAVVLVIMFAITKQNHI